MIPTDFPTPMKVPNTVSLLTGDWSGILEAPSNALEVVLHIREDAGKLTGSLDSIDQGTLGIPGSDLSICGSELEIHFPSIQASYHGTLVDGELCGHFNQLGSQFELNLVRAVGVARVIRPQEPTAPFPYSVEAITFGNESDGIRLAGTLTLPAREPARAAIVMVSGSGAHDRDEEVFGHKPFLIIADFLTRSGYAVLRFDDRGVGESGGDCALSSLQTSVQDVLSALAFIDADRRLKRCPRGVIGHSEGGLVGGVVARRDPGVNFVIMLATPGVPGDRLFKSQVEAIYSATEQGKGRFSKQQKYLDRIIEIVLGAGLDDDISSELRPIVRQSVQMDIGDDAAVEKLTDRQVATFNHPAFRAIIHCQPKELLAGIDVPILALAGEKDLQVLAASNLDAIKSIVDWDGGRDLVTAKILPGLNHLFQTATTGLPQEYGAIEETFSPRALDEIERWLDRLPRRPGIAHYP